MGWGRTLLLGDIGNRLDIADTENDIANMKKEIAGAFNKDMTQDRKIEALIEENAELKLYLASVVRLLTTKGTISPEELRATVNAIDAEDGSSSGTYDGNIA